MSTAAGFMPSEMSANNIQQYLTAVRSNIPLEEENTYKNLNKYSLYSKKLASFKKSLNWLGEANANSLRNTFKNGAYNDFLPYLSNTTKAKIKLGKNLESTQKNITNIQKALEHLKKTPTARFMKKTTPYPTRKNCGGGSNGSNGSNATRRSKNRRA